MDSQWHKSTVAQLRTALKERGIKQSGNKAELVSKLDQYDREAAESTNQSSYEASPEEISAKTNEEDEGSLANAVSAAEGPLQTEGGSPAAVPVAPATSFAGTLPHPNSISELPIAPTPEILQDSQKRRRRSGSPDPTASEINQKRMRTTIATTTEVPDIEAASTLGQLEGTKRSPGFMEAIAPPLGDLATSNSLTLGAAEKDVRIETSTATKPSSSGVTEESISGAIKPAEPFEISRLHTAAPGNAMSFTKSSEIDGVTTEAMEHEVSEVKPAAAAMIEETDGVHERLADGLSTAVESERPEAAFAPASETRRSYGADTDPKPLGAVALTQETKDIQDTIMDHPMTDANFESFTENRVDADNRSTDQMIKEDAGYDEELQVEPSLHRHTTALYIRNFMRPLRLNAVEEYIAAKVNLPAAVPNTPTLVSFYLDGVKSHVFVELASIPAARMVRAALHGKVWPDERNRKALWVDFIPPEKIPSWIEAENAALAGNYRNTSKKWEVVYNRVGDHMVATHQEKTATNTMRHQPADSTAPTLAPPDSGRAGPPPSRTFPGAEGAPFGPKGFVKPPSLGTVPGTITQGDRPIFTTHGPNPVAYQPVSKELAERRLQVIQSHKARDLDKRHLGKEKNRYWFEDGDRFIDRGPEMFEGIRPPHRERQHQARLRQRRGGYGGGWEGSYRSQPRERFGGGGPRASASYNNHRGRNAGRDDNPNHDEGRRDKYRQRDDSDRRDRRDNYSRRDDAPRYDDYRSGRSSRGYSSRR